MSLALRWIQVIWPFGCVKTVALAMATQLPTPQRSNAPIVGFHNTSGDNFTANFGATRLCTRYRRASPPAGRCDAYHQGKWGMQMATDADHQHSRREPQPMRRSAPNRLGPISLRSTEGENLERKLLFRCISGSLGEANCASSNMLSSAICTRHMRNPR